MGWLDDWWYKDDPLHGVDPSLRRYLETKAPKKYAPSNEPLNAAPKSYREQIGLVDPNQAARARQQAAEAELPEGSRPSRPLPKESAYQDGRYAALWKDYRPQTELEDAGKSDNEKLTDVVAAFKDAGASVGRAAQENCADEQWNVHDCFRNGGWSSRFTMCKAENRSLSRCIDMQKRFLKALGFFTMNARPEDESEQIQMHADRLYHRMLDHEKRVVDAKTKGNLPPPLPRLLDDSELTALHALQKERDPDRDRLTLDDLPPDIQKRLSKQYFGDLTGEERELAKRGLDYDLEANAYLVLGIRERWVVDHRNRMRRRALGKETMEDKVFKYFDFRTYPDEEEDAESK